jgi:predicted nuclease of predicted toxin-antitoxin system
MTKLQLDANISWRITNTIALHFEGSIHVEQTSLQKPAKDLDIWNFALQNSYVIVTNDEDFIHLINTRNYPPKLILLKTGNQSSRFIAETLIKHNTKMMYKSTRNFPRIMPM